MQIQVFTPDDAGWKETLTRLTHDIYHTPAYALIEARRLKAMPEAILVSDGEQQLFLPYLLRSCDCLFTGLHDTVRDVVSAYGYPGILLSKQGRNQQFATAAWKLICEHMIAQNVCAAFLRMHPILGDGIEQFLPPGILLETGPTVAVDLQLEEDLLRQQMAKNHRRTIAKSQKLGFTARIVKLNEVLESFIDIYTQTMDRVNAQGSYYFDHAYFNSLAEMPGIQCCVVESGSLIIAACIIFESGGIIQYHLGGTATSYYANSPFHLCLFHVMLWAKNRGNHWVHLGGGVGGENDQLLRFKEGFSPQRFKYQTARVVFEDSLYRELVDSAAAAMNCSAEELLESNFFPAYRSRSLEKV
jgi:hypothetical protein